MTWQTIAGRSADTCAQVAFSDPVVYDRPPTAEQVSIRYWASQVTIELGEENNAGVTVTIQSGESAIPLSLDGTVTVDVAAGTFPERADLTLTPVGVSVPQGGGSLSLRGWASWGRGTLTVAREEQRPPVDVG